MFTQHASKEMKWINNVNLFILRSIGMMKGSKYSVIFLFSFTVLCLILTEYILHGRLSVRRWFKDSNTEYTNTTRSEDKVTNWINHTPLEYNVWYNKKHDKLDRIPLQMEFVPSRYSYSLQKEMQPKVKVILRYSGFNRHQFHGGVVEPGRKTFETCPVRHCSVTGSRKDISFVDAVVFEDDPPRRNPELFPSLQVWIFFTAESPVLSGLYKGTSEYNWTATYRLDSTLPVPTHSFIANNDSRGITQLKNRNYAKGKTKRVAWVVSHCSTDSKREVYVQELKKYINVDIYGRCGTRRLKKENCFEKIAKDYKFYLSLENAKCRYYITEKFFKNAMSYDILPIVMGAAPEDYERVAPPHSYINVEDFKSPKELAAYMHMLDNNDTLYNEYFKWKGSGQYVFKLELKFWCRLCAMLHAADDRAPTWYTNLQQWWRGPGVCIGRDYWRDHPRDKK